MGLLDYLNFSQSGNGGLLGSLGAGNGQFPLSPLEKQQQDMLLAGLGAGGTSYDGSSPQGGGPPGMFSNAQPWSPQAMPRTIMDLLPQQPQQPQQQQASQSPQPSVWDNPQQFQPAPQTAAPSPASMNSFAGLQVPTFGQPDPVALPPNAQPAGPAQQAPQQQQQQLPPALSSPSGLAGAGRGLMANAGNGPLGMLLGGIGGAMGMQSDAKANLKAEYDVTRQTLLSKGYGDKEASSAAMLAVMNKDAAKTILPEMLTSKTEIKMVKDALGEEHPYSWNPREQTFKPVGANGELSGGASPQGASLLAPGVKQYNPSLSGDAYLGQFGPEVQSAVKAYIKGDVMPSGNPRMQAIQTKAKEIAQKYGQDMGIPVSDAIYSEKRKYYTELGTNSPNSAGGQAKAFNQGISHMTGLAGNLEKLDNSNGLGIPAVAQVVNGTRQAFSTQQSAISDEAKSLGQTVAGEVGKLFSGSAGGGVHERELTRDRFDTVKSKPQLAAALRATLETMDGGLKALEQRRDSILGPNSGVELVSNETRQNITKIQAAIDRLDGKAPAGNSAVPGVTRNGVKWSVQ